jgi:hypothetical protein
VLRLLAGGRSNAEIAADPVVSHVDREPDVGRVGRLLTTDPGTD